MPAIDDDLYFRTRKEAHEWLQVNGFNVSQGKFYGDIKKNGFPVVNADKTVSKYQVSEYGRSLKAERAPNLSALERSEYLHRKEKAEAEMAEIKAEKMRRELSEEWMKKLEGWSAVSTLIISLRDALRRAAHDGKEELAGAAGGELLRAPELYEKIDELVINRAFNEVVGVRLDIEWEVEE